MLRTWPPRIPALGSGTSQKNMSACKLQNGLFIPNAGERQRREAEERGSGESDNIAEDHQLLKQCSTISVALLLVSRAVRASAVNRPVGRMSTTWDFCVAMLPCTWKI